MEGGEGQCDALQLSHNWWWPSYNSSTTHSILQIQGVKVYCNLTSRDCAVLERSQWQNCKYPFSVQIPTQQNLERWLSLPAKPHCSKAFWQSKQYFLKHLFSSFGTFLPSTLLMSNYLHNPWSQSPGLGEDRRLSLALLHPQRPRAVLEDVILGH